MSSGVGLAKRSARRSLGVPFCHAVRPEAVKFSSKRIPESAVGNPQLGFSSLYLVRRPGIVQSRAGRQYAQAGNVAVSKGIIEIYRGADTVLAGVAIALSVSAVAEVAAGAIRTLGASFGKIGEGGSCCNWLPAVGGCAANKPGAMASKARGINLVDKVIGA